MSLTYLHIKVTDEEKESLKLLADAEHRTMSSMMRVLIINETKRRKRNEDHNE